LLAVADYFMQSVNLPDQCRTDITSIISYVHRSVTSNYSPSFEVKFKRKNFATPKNYLDFLENYAQMLELNRGKVDQLSQRLGSGLEKLISAAEQVAVMSKQLEEKLVVVEANAKNVANLIEEINTKTEIAQKRQIEAETA